MMIVVRDVIADVVQYRCVLQKLSVLLIQAMQLFGVVEYSRGEPHRVM